VSKICCLLNYPAHYRESIFKLISKNFDVDFYFAEELSNIKKMDVNSLKGYKGTLRVLKLGNFFFYYNLDKIINRKYTHYILTGNPWVINNWLVLFYAIFFKKKVILWSHGFYGKENNIVKKIKKIFFNLASDVLLYGNYSKNLMIKDGIEKNKLHVVYNSLDYEKMLYYRKKTSQNNIYINYFKNNNPVIVYIGRVQTVKKIDMILYALKYLKKKNENYNFVLIGSKEEDIDIDRILIEENLSDNVWLYGACYDESLISSLLYNANVCVSPGNVGLTAIHSLMYGCPVITNDDFSNQMPEFEAVVPNKTGLFFMKDNIEDLAEKISIICSSKNSFKEDCFKTIDEKYNPENQINIIKQVLKN